MQHGLRRTAAQAKAHPRIRHSPALPEVAPVNARSSRGPQSPAETYSNPNIDGKALETLRSDARLQWADQRGQGTNPEWRPTRTHLDMNPRPPIKANTAKIERTLSLGY